MFKHGNCTLIGYDQKTHRVFQVHISTDKYPVSTKEVYDYLNDHNYKFADPLTALQYCNRWPERYQQNSLLTVFMACDQMWGMCFHEEGGLRNLTTGSISVNTQWGGGYSFLAVESYRY